MLNDLTINASASRTSMAVAALTVAVSATVGVGVMVHSFRHTFNEWLQQSLPGDIYLSPSGAAPAAGGLPPSLVQTLRRLPGVAAVGRNRMARVETEWGQQRLTVLDGDASQRYSTRVLAVKAGVENAMEAFARGEGILVSEPLAYHRQLQVGSSMRVHTDHGAKSLPVLGIFYDYTSSVGLIAMHRSLYTKLWHDRGISGLSVFAAADTSQSELLKAVRNAVGEAAIVRSNREIRDRSLAIFEHTFAITHILRVLVIAVAFIGIFSALMSVQLERLRELAILRVTGMTPAEVSAVVIGQAAVMGFLAALLALPLGLVTAVVLIDVVNLRSFGWSLQFVVPPGVLVEAQILSVTAALLAGSYPALKAVYISPAHALREE
ncbi:MAG: ABC transporter permease [Exilibacterium sp.]